MTPDGESAPASQVVGDLVCFAARGLGVYDCGLELVCPCKVVGLDLCNEPSNGVDKCVHTGVFLRGSRGCKPLNPVGLGVRLAG